MLTLRHLLLAGSVALSFGLLPVAEAAAAEPPAACKRGRKLRKKAKKAKGKRKHHRKGRKGARKHRRAHR